MDRNELAKAIFEDLGCLVDRCKWGQRPCSCQERYLESASQAIRALAKRGILLGEPDVCEIDNPTVGGED